MLNQIINTEPWVAEAICAQTDPDLFFPEIRQSPRRAKAICQRCPVQKPCLAYALELGSDADGVWGGTTAYERLRIRRGLPPRTPPKPREIKHGMSGYKQGCKCAECLAGWAEYQRQWSRARRKPRQCQDCGEQITGTGRRTLCNTCRAKWAA